MLLEPIWLMLIAPAALLWWRTRSRGRSIRVLRAVALAALVLAAARPAMEMNRGGGTVVAVVDRSASMPSDSDRRVLEALGVVARGMGPEDRLGIVTFGDAAYVEQIPAHRVPQRFDVAIDDSASNLGRAVGAALSLIEAERGGRVLLFTDGRSTDTRSRELAAVARARGLAMDYRFLGRSTEGDVSIQALELPSRVRQRDGFLINVWVDSPDLREASYTLLREGVVIARDTASLEPGRNRLTFRDMADTSGQLAYTFQLDVSDTDPIPENNLARAFVGVEASSRVLVVTRTPGQGLARLLRQSGLEVAVAEPDAVDWSLGALAGYAAFVIENVPVQDMGLSGAENLAALVRDRGAGLVMTGGWKSFAAGGYLDSPLAPILPVDLELRAEFRKLRVSIVVALDRSGSMAMVASGGRTKMALAGLAAASILDLLTPIDRFGAIAVDSEAHEIVPLKAVADAGDAGTRLRSLQAMGGGIYVHVALLRAASMIMDAEPGAKHVILFADAADAEVPGDYQTLLAKMVDAGVTVSVVGLGTERDVDANLLKSIATLGKGRALFTSDPHLLPQLFTQDAIAVARSAFLDTPSRVARTGELVAMLAHDPGPLPPIGGYNPTTARPEASIDAVTEDEYRAPLLAHWGVGLGRVAAYTGEADGVHTGEIASWDNLGEFWGGIVRSVLPDRSSLGNEAVAAQSIRGNVAVIDLYVDPDKPMAIGRPSVRVLRKRPGQPPRSEVVRMTLAAPDKLVAEVYIAGDEVIVPTIELEDGRVEAMAPVVLPVSTEHASPDAWQGERLMRDLAAMTGGIERTDLTGIWSEVPRSLKITSLTPVLFGLGIVLVVAEVFQRRIGLATIVGGRRAALSAARDHKESGAPGRTRTARSAGAPPARTAEATTPRPGIERSAAPPEQSGGVLDAMSELRKKRD